MYPPKWSDLEDYIKNTYKGINMNEIKPELLKLTSNDAQEILDDFEILNTNLDSYKQKIEELQANKIYFDNYISNLQNNHMNIMNIKSQ